MIAITPTIRPPAPRPCTARNAISSTIPLPLPPSSAEPDIPQSADPIRKMTTEVRKIALRPYRSPSLPQIGVETVVPSTYAVTTQVKWLTPPNSLTIRGSAVLTIMLSSIASIIAIIRPNSTTRMLGFTVAWVS